MRICFGELSAEEQHERERICRAARAVWHLVRDGEADSARQSLSALDERLELYVAEHAGTRLVELSALTSSAWPLAQLLLAQAPADIGCALSLGRGALPLSQALSELQLSHGLDLSRASLRAGFGRGHLLEITLGLPGGVGSDHEQNAAENLVRAVVGERVFETWIGAVHAVPAPRFPSLRVLDVRAPRASLQVSDLFDTVAAATRGVLRGLPASPRASWLPPSSVSTTVERSSVDADREEWTLLEIEPLADERGGRKDDLLLASTCTPELLRCYLDGSPCASRRFSGANEQFVFVSYEDVEQTMAARVARRTVIEMALAETVVGIGAVTGVGFGVKTSYIDLALSNLETGLVRLVAKLRELQVPPETFIQFFDSELAEEWLAIWPDSRLPEA